MLCWLLSSIKVAGVETVLLPMPSDDSVQLAPGAPGVSSEIDCVVPLVIEAHPASSTTEAEQSNWRNESMNLPHERQPDNQPSF
jgi:hypothetical protein